MRRENKDPELYPDSSDKSTPKSSPSPSPSASSTPKSPGATGSGYNTVEEFTSGFSVIGASGGVGRDAEDPLVYVGASDPKEHYRVGYGDTEGGELVVPPKLLPASEVKMQFYEWSIATKNSWGEKLAFLGLISEEDAHDHFLLKQLWYEYVDEAANFWARGKKITPGAVPEVIAGVRDTNGKFTLKDPDPNAGPDKGFTGSRTKVDVNAALSTALGAKKLVNEVLQKALGRNANQEEFDAFLALLNETERADPFKRTTTTDFEDGIEVGSNSVDSGGVTDDERTQLITDEAMQKPEYGAYQAATTYYNAFIEAIKAPVSYN